MPRKRRNRKQKANNAGAPPRSRRRTRKLPPQLAACSLSPAATDYALALLDPQTGPLIGIPNGSAVLSRKYRVWAKGMFTTGAAAPTDLSVLMNPWAALWNSQYWVWAVPPSVAQQLKDFNAHPPTLGVNPSECLFSNTPYSLADNVSGGTYGRVVACQLKIRYAGTELNKGGVITSLQDPNHTGVQNLTVGALNRYSSAQRTNVTNQKGWMVINYRPSDVQDCYYLSGHTGGTTNCNAAYISDNSTVAWDEFPFMGAYIAGAAASQPYEVEAWAIVEYTGPNVTGKTVNAADVQGYQCVLNALAVVEEAGLITNMMSDRQNKLGPAAKFGSTGTKAHGNFNFGATPVSTTPGVAEIVVNAASELYNEAQPMLINAATNAAMKGLRASMRRLIQ